MVIKTNLICSLLFSLAFMVTLEGYGQKIPKNDVAPGNPRVMPGPVENRVATERRFPDSIESFRSANHTRAQVLASYRLGQWYIKAEKYPEAINVLNAALATLSTPDAVPDTLISYINLALLLSHFQLGNYSETISGLQKVSKSFKNISSKNKITIFSQISFLWMGMPEAYQPEGYNKSLYYLQLAEQIARQENDTARLSVILNNEGHNYMKLKDWVKSEAYLQQSILLNGKNNHQALLTLGEVYLAQQKYAKALPYLQEARLIIKTNDANYAYGILKLAEAHLHLNNAKLADLFIREAEQLAKKQKRNHLLMDIYQVKSELKISQGDYREALIYYKLNNTLQDSLNFKDAVKSMQVMDTKYRASAANRKLLERQLFIRKQSQLLERKNSQIILLVLSLTITGISILALYSRMARKRNLLNQRNSIRMLMATLSGEEKERQRIARELHDGIGGMLAVMNMNFLTAQKYHFKNEKQNNKILKMLADITGEVHRTAHNLLPAAMEEHDLVKAVGILCDELNHNSGHIKADFQVNGDPAFTDQVFNTAIYRVIQELLQNTIKHSGASHITIILEKKEEEIRLHVSDNGKGFAVYGPKQKSLGMKNIEKRVSDLGGSLKVVSGIGAGTATSMFFKHQGARPDSAHIIPEARHHYTPGAQ